MEDCAVGYSPGGIWFELRNDLDSQKFSRDQSRINATARDMTERSSQNDFVERSQELTSAGISLHGASRVMEAITKYQEALRLAPELAAARHMLGLAFHQIGRSGEAMVELDTALVHTPNDPILLANRASVLLALGRIEEAERSSRDALFLCPDSFSAHFNLGLALETSGRASESIESFTRALVIRPDDTSAAKALGRVAIVCRDPNAAQKALSCVPFATGPADPIVVGDLWEICGEIQRAWRAWETAFNDNRRIQKARLRIARTALGAGRPDITVEQTDALLRLYPDSRDGLLLRALALHEEGLIVDAICEYRKLLTRYPEFAEAQSNYLTALQHLPTTVPSELFVAAQQWAQRHAPPSDYQFSSFSQCARRKIIWVSPRFAEGPVHTFFSETLAALLERGDAEHILVMTGQLADGATRQFQKLADRWIDGSRLSDADMLVQLREVQADVAIDLAGHAPRNRLRVFAHRIAPRQCTWLDNFATTGIPAIDDFLTDEQLTPNGSEADFTERIIRLPYGRLCYSPPKLAQASRSLHDTRAERMFVSFNRMAKITPEVLSVWAQILHKLPGWRILLRNSVMASAVVRERVLRVFAAHGIDAARVEMEGFHTYANTIETYARAAIALDTFPFSGCATTCDALWMGVPVVTLCGESLVSRQSAALLAQCGLDNWIASSIDQYIDIACELAASVESRELRRDELRDRITLHLTDANQFADALYQSALAGV